jgi:hypothetical protein
MKIAFGVIHLLLILFTNLIINKNENIKIYWNGYYCRNYEC